MPSRILLELVRACLPARNGNRTAVGGKLHSIGYEIEKYLLYSLSIRCNKLNILWYLYRKVDPVLPGAHTE